MKIFIATVMVVAALATVALVCLSEALPSHGKTTRYWDCCKPSCAWSKWVKLDSFKLTTPVQSCAKDGVTPVAHDTTSVCGGGGIPGKSYMCNDQIPWAVNSSLAFGFAATNFAKHNDTGFCCTCWELTFTTGHVAGKKMVVQVTNSGGADPFTFDLQMPGGGVGHYTKGCADQWNATSGWGQQWGGVANRSTCAEMPAALQEGCHWHYDWFMGASNPEVDAVQVHCPASITKRSGCVRDDEKPMTDISDKYAHM